MDSILGWSGFTIREFIKIIPPQYVSPKAKEKAFRQFLLDEKLLEKSYRDDAKYAPTSYAARRGWIVWKSSTLPNGKDYRTAIITPLGARFFLHSTFSVPTPEAENIILYCASQIAAQIAVSTIRERWHRDDHPYIDPEAWGPPEYGIDEDFNAGGNDCHD